MKKSHLSYMFFASCQFRLYYEALHEDLTSILCFLYIRNELEPISSSIMLSKLAVLFLKREYQNNVNNSIVKKQTTCRQAGELLPNGHFSISANKAGKKEPEKPLQGYIM